MIQNIDWPLPEWPGRGRSFGAIGMPFDCNEYFVCSIVYGVKKQIIQKKIHIISYSLSLSNLYCHKELQYPGEYILKNITGL